MQVIITTEGFQEAAAKLSAMDSGLHAHLRRAFFRIGGLWRRTAVAYAPISPSTTMLRKFVKQRKSGDIFWRTIKVKGRRGNPGQVVGLTQFYEDQLNMLLSKNSTTRPMPGGLMKSINFASDDSKVECFVPANSLAGKYAFKMHEEKGKSWKHRGPGTQAKGPQADDKFISRAAIDKQSDFTAIITDEVNKLLGGNNA